MTVKSHACCLTVDQLAQTMDVSQEAVLQDIASLSLKGLLTFCPEHEGGYKETSSGKAVLESILGPREVCMTFLALLLRLPIILARVAYYGTLLRVEERRDAMSQSGMIIIIIIVVVVLLLVTGIIRFGAGA